MFAVGRTNETGNREIDFGSGFGPPPDLGDGDSNGNDGAIKSFVKISLPYYTSCTIVLYYSSNTL